MDTLPALAAFAFATSVTPGPNVIMVAASAANHGVRATLPHMAGITIGFPVMIVLVGLGLAGPFAANPDLHTALKWIGAAWIVWLAWKIARAADPGDGALTPLVIAAVFLLVSPPSVGFWAVVGAGAGRILRSPAQLRAFNVTMAILLVLSLVPALV